MTIKIIHLVLAISLVLVSTFYISAEQARHISPYLNNTITTVCIIIGLIYLYRINKYSALIALVAIIIFYYNIMNLTNNNNNYVSKNKAVLVPIKTDVVNNNYTVPTINKATKVIANKAALVPANIEKMTDTDSNPYSEISEGQTIYNNIKVVTTNIINENPDITSKEIVDLLINQYDLSPNLISNAVNDVYLNYNNDDNSSTYDIHNLENNYQKQPYHQIEYNETKRIKDYLTKDDTFSDVKSFNSDNEHYQHLDQEQEGYNYNIQPNIPLDTFSGYDESDMVQMTL